ncbi:family 3 glycosyl hydrolase [Plasmopara halstedii]|uniref:beta-glucosidase n=1 Tax=Plasmopara halstedii TaxID=4781 RepID=A0A0P1AT00_PLAHL|nr:family 3 glycosyl hydrolase [Plasmopara halstedii]CEG45119.1 family 3 glycosyl hydrolase [Plasmopara halstedii]|eukprot:XP_024581488.1 family 3 glycosyl hydrolase [Plasmopara halstedii]
MAAEENDIEIRAQSIIDSLSLDQVIGQMTQLDLNTIMTKNRTLDEDLVRFNAKHGVGSYFNSVWGSPLNGKYGWTAAEFRAIITRIQEINMEENGGHPILYGIDSGHGANYVDDAILFPHQINSGACFNTDLVYEVARIAARDSLSAGISMLFGPTLDIATSALWSRTFESFGEDPFLASVMAEATVRGIQSYNQSAACMKHFIGYSNAHTGKNRDNVIMSDFDLLNYFVLPYKAAIDAGALTLIESYNSINGEPVISSSRILNDLLRTDLGFNGLLISDWGEVTNLADWHRSVKTREESVAMVLTKTSLDMSMVPNDLSFINHTQAFIEKFPEYEDRLRQSAKRAVATKLKLGLYENPVPGADYVDLVGGEDDKKVALEISRESIVLLKNENNVLPLSKKASVFLTGHSADNIGYQCGGWTKAWQGYSGNVMFPHGISLRQGFENLVGNESFQYFNGLFVNGTISEEDLASAVNYASGHEYTVVAIGERSYTEGPGEIEDLTLPAGQIQYVEALAKTGTKVIVVLFEGRPRLLGSIPNVASAIINGLLPCEFGGQAMAEIIYGDVNPSGRLPITYPKYPANVNIHYNRLVSTQCSYGVCQHEFNFGDGLSYTTFNYSNVTLDRTVMSSASDVVTATVTVTNTGDRAGKEVVMLFITQPFRLISVPEVKQLKKFNKIELQPGESMDVSFALTIDDVSVYDPQIGKGLKRVYEDTDFVISIRPETSCDVYGNLDHPQCIMFSVNTNSGAVSNPIDSFPGEQIL